MSGGPINPWPTPPKRDPDAAARSTSAPAQGLILVGIINSILALIVVMGGLGPTKYFGLGTAEGLFGLVELVGSLTTLAGGVSLLRLRRFGLVRAGSVFAMIPFVSPCLILGLPIGIWAFVVTGRPDVRGAFRDGG